MIFKRLEGIPNVALLVRPMVHSMFIIHKNGENTSIIQPILKSNSTSFMLYTFFSVMNIKKLPTGGIQGEPSLFSSWKWNY